MKLVRPCISKGGYYGVLRMNPEYSDLLYSHQAYKWLSFRIIKYG